jgi:non-ribosomal peptide synthetase component F
LYDIPLFASPALTLFFPLFFFFLQGLFANVLVIRTPSISSLKTFPALLAHVNDTVLQALDNQEMPFNQIVSEVNPTRDGRSNPLFSASLVVHTERSSSSAWGGAGTQAKDLPLTLVAYNPWVWDTHSTRYDLNFQLWPHEGGFEGMLEYSCDIFKEDTVARIAGNLKSLLEAIVVNWQQGTTIFFPSISPILSLHSNTLLRH